jgi:hypothetical protein
LLEISKHVVLLGKSVCGIDNWFGQSNVKVKESHNRPGVAQRVPGGLGAQIL